MLSSCKSQQLFQLCERMLWISLALFELICSNKIQSLCSCNLYTWPTPTFHRRICNEDGIIFLVVSTLKMMYFRTDASQLYGITVFLNLFEFTEKSKWMCFCTFLPWYANLTGRPLISLLYEFYTLRSKILFL